MNTNWVWMEKYRPQNINELVLEPTTKELLTKFIEDENVPHLLLAGNVGTGKTTIAKILVKELDCDYMLLNASDERGIDVIRNKIKQFAMVNSFKQWKIVFLDEMDNLTPDAQYSLRNLMETYSEHTRFIGTCNYLNKIIEPIRSRFQLIEFQNLQRKQIRALLERILTAEKVKYDVDELIQLVDKFYPDIRSMINSLQLYSTNGHWSLKGSDNFRGLDILLTSLKKKDLKSIRELTLDYTEAYRFLFNRVDEITEDYGTRVELSLLVAEYLYRDVFIADKSINFSACCLAMMEKM